SCRTDYNTLVSACYIFFSCTRDHPDLHSFPTRRSSDLELDALARQVGSALDAAKIDRAAICGVSFGGLVALRFAARFASRCSARSEEHTSELQSLAYLVCRLLLEKKKKIKVTNIHNTSC